VVVVCTSVEIVIDRDEKKIDEDEHADAVAHQ
jgi:hypothetical protein